MMDGLSHSWQENKIFPKSESSATAQPHWPCFALYTETISQQLGAQKGLR